MTDKLQKIIKEEVAKLPKDAQDAINAFDWAKAVEEIGSKHLLDESEVNDFQVETLLVLVGLIDPQFYPVNIENHVGTTKDSATKMADEAYEKVFTPISNTIEENIKKNLKNKKPNATQTLNFILSGGDYSTFVAPSPSQGEGRGEVHPTPPSLADIQANMNKTSLKDKLVI
ncbi:hypothetical protein A2W67_00750 [Candidatus Nomurabacteria bacterium RIFCSPLOWO2_02_40_28]|uniref:Uncharacterized protein n=2 Tax=Candidatus Nomuraibacteriota TaxID=1752729 RepID=A0A837HU49_9BACT|nr:MAG: hypothetical protein UT27_C0003G0021 [Candidatus Nomurabacteria bacterium GW2011_GWD2_39_12]KKR20752.1 MAG: hypothetical protein UT51_C0002G0187 [Candidatus Nomurabacteria bacterium GW2011_GWC2_39_41]KKR36859.1 MAG: hypothetical protein UT70_C0005G0006 [Candidatus Nomurabacteria bacterium GW2011_GWE2_40_10]KKR38567.1 MAG: hypothetical protein UT73_C0002G0052 [Candidatus Nomurabacteria bacterium GW2011_GWB1_40_11]KKR40292.1 MAG: hypothetical protein UT74_C0001G0026 [Parcubacteria group b